MPLPSPEPSLFRQRSSALLLVIVSLATLGMLAASCGGPEATPTATPTPAAPSISSTPAVRLLRVLLPDMVCIPCAKSIEASLAALPGVTNATVNFQEGTGAMYYLADSITKEEILRNPIFDFYTAVLDSDAPVTREAPRPGPTTPRPAWFLEVERLVQSAREASAANDVAAYVKAVQEMRTQLSPVAHLHDHHNEVFQIRTMGLLSGLMFGSDAVYPDDPRFEALRLTEAVRTEVAPMDALAVKSLANTAERRVQDLLTRPASAERVALMLAVYQEELQKLDVALDAMSRAAQGKQVLLDFTFHTNRTVNLLLEQHSFVLEDFILPQVAPITALATTIREKTAKANTVVELTRPEETDAVLAWARRTSLPTNRDTLKYQIKLTYGDLLKGGFCSLTPDVRACEGQLQEWGG